MKNKEVEIVTNGLSGLILFQLLLKDNCFLFLTETICFGFRWSFTFFTL